MAFDEIVVESGVGIGRAVGGNEQPGPVKIGRMRRDELELDRPLTEL